MALPGTGRRLRAAPRPRGDTEEAHDECAICFDAITECMLLPCRCNVSYCFRCWDRCLAQSFVACGRARCPTCRGPVRVDYDSETGHLSFTPECEELLEEALPRHRQQAASRLLEQARPAQRRLLGAYGASQPELAALRHTPSSAAPIEVRRIVAAFAAARLPEALPPDFAEGAPEEKAISRAASRQPPCVCGGALKRMPSVARYEELVRSLLPGCPDDLQHPVIQRVIVQLVDAGSVVCDLCSKPIDMAAGVWTCKSQDLTILHATSYDVCDGCFVLHSCGV